MTEYHKELRALNRAYAAFLMATALFISANAEANECAGLVVTLLAISIPSVLAYSGLARITETDEKRNPEFWSLLSMLAAYIPSVIALAILLSRASVYASITFLTTAAAWVIIVIRLRRNPG